MLKCGSSTHTGRPSWKGTKRTFCRYLGTRGSLAATIPSSSSRSGAGPSKMPTEAMCMWFTSFSMWRNDASSGLKRSMGPDATPGAPGPGPGRRRAGATSGRVALLGARPRSHRLQGVLQTLGDVGNQVEGDPVPDRLGDVVEVRPVAGGEDALRQPGPVGGQDLLLHPADG